MSKLRGNLRDDDMAKIKRNYTFLLKELDGNFLANCLLERDVFDFEDKDDISCQSSVRETNELFLKKLRHCGPFQAYDVFLEALREHYPHVADRLEGLPHQDGDDGEKKQELSKASTEIELRLAKNIAEIFGNIILNAINNGDIGRSPDLILAPSFNIQHLDEEFQYKEVVDYIRCLAEQTGLIVVVDVGNNKPVYHPSCDSKNMTNALFGSGRVWRVRRRFSQVDGTTCPCVECQDSATPRKQWGEFIVVTSIKTIHSTRECRQSIIMLGYDSYKDNTGVSALRGVSVISNSGISGASKALYITHDADTSKRLEGICRRNSVYRDKLLNMCHLLHEDQALAVLIAHPSFRPKHIQVGEWRSETDKTPDSKDRINMVYAKPDCCGGTVLIVNDSTAFVNVFDYWDPRTGIGLCNGKDWSL